MKINELRVGNYVLGVMDIHENLKITLQSQIDLFYKYYFPIKINENWLLKFGFEDISEDKNGMALRLMINKTEELAVYKNDNTGVRFQTRLSGFTRHFPISYIHELQNLYFYLTGEELTIKEQDEKNA